MAPSGTRSAWSRHSPRNLQLRCLPLRPRPRAVQGACRPSEVPNGRRRGRPWRWWNRRCFLGTCAERSLRKFQVPNKHLNPCAAQSKTQEKAHIVLHNCHGCCAGLFFDHHVPGQGSQGLAAVSIAFLKPQFFLASFHCIFPVLTFHLLSPALSTAPKRLDRGWRGANLEFWAACLSCHRSLVPSGQQQSHSRFKRLAPTVDLILSGSWVSCLSVAATNLCKKWKGQTFRRWS